MVGQAIRPLGRGRARRDGKIDRGRREEQFGMEPSLLRRQWGREARGRQEHCRQGQRNKVSWICWVMLRSRDAMTDA